MEEGPYVVEETQVPLISVSPTEWAISIQPSIGPQAGKFFRIGYDGRVEASMEPSEAARLFAEAVGPLLAAYRPKVGE